MLQRLRERDRASQISGYVDGLVASRRRGDPSDRLMSADADAEDLRALSRALSRIEVRPPAGLLAAVRRVLVRLVRRGASKAGVWAVPLVLALWPVTAHPRMQEARAAPPAAAGVEAARPGPALRTLTEQELVDLMVGASILCTRGSNTESMIERVRAALREGLVFRLVALEDVPDDWLGFTSFGVGGGGAWEHVTQRMERRGFQRDPNAPTAADVLSRYLGRSFDVTFEAETGGATLGALLTGARMGIPVIDGCPSGRCLPEVQMSPFFLNGVTRAPLAGVTRYGDVIIIPRVLDDFRVEDLTRGIAVASGGSVSVAANALPGRVLKRHLIPGFLSKGIALGRAAREATAAGRDPVAAVVRAGHGFLLFRGIVRRSDTRGERGFGWTEAVIEGIGHDSGSQYRIYNKNENMIAWRDGRLDAAAPDLIAAVDPGTGWAIRGGSVIGSFVVGQEVAIVGFPNHAIWRTPEAIEMLGPRHFGFDEEYVPIERLHPRSK